jgi:hypothetical protein
VSHENFGAVNRELERLEREDDRLWRAIHRILAELHPVTSFTAELEINMPFQAGATAVIDFTPVPAGSKLVSAPTITSSDPVNAPVTEDSTGLIATVVFPASAPVGESVTISISYTNPDGTVATGAFTDTIAAAPAPDVTGFTGVLAS